MFHMHTKKMDMARERMSDLGAGGDVLIVPDKLSLVTAAVVWAILDSTSGLDP